MHSQPACTIRLSIHVTCTELWTLLYFQGMEVMHQLIWCLRIPQFLIYRLQELLLVPDTEIVLCSLVTLYSASLGGNIPAHCDKLVATLVQLVTSYWSDLDFEAVQDTNDDSKNESVISENTSSSTCLSSAMNAFYKLLAAPSLGHRSSTNDRYR